MADIQHKDIPDAERHDPKGLSSASASQVFVASAANAGSWRKLREIDLDYSNKANNIFGWNDISDSQYTSGAPRSVASATRTQMTNNALATQTDTSRLGSIWDTANNRFLINDLNAFYILNVNMKVKAAAAAGTPYQLTIELESANGPTVIRGQTDFIKGGDVVNQKSFALPFYLGSFINNQFLRLYATADTAITLYDVGFVIQRTYKES